jgi:hypothetical protein
VPTAGRVSQKLSAAARGHSPHFQLVAVSLFAVREETEQQNGTKLFVCLQSAREIERIDLLRVQIDDDYRGMITARAASITAFVVRATHGPNDCYTFGF